MKIIAFTGKFQSGKTTCANLIQNSVKLSFAKPIKDIAKIYFGWNGDKDDKGRRLLQVIGTNAGREYNSNIWVEKMHEQLLHEKTFEESKNKDVDTIIIIDDLRFNNEAEFIIKWKGIIINITRPGYDGDAHVSEIGILDEYVDYTINNDGTIEELKNKLLEIIKKIL